MNIYILLVVLFVLVLQQVDAAPNCTTLSNSFEAKLNNSCASVVDYSFFVPDGMTVEDLAVQANRQMNATSLKILPVECQKAVRDLVCSNVYLKCYPNIDLSSLSTYNFKIYNDVHGRYPVPIVRPCWSTCSAVAQQCSGLYHVGHTFPDCSATFDYSGVGYSGGTSTPLRYDNSTQCFSPLDVPVASSNESYQYRHGGVCAGIVDDVYVPPGAAVHPYYSVFQEPFAMQRVIEETLVTKTSAIPAWLQSECRLAMLRYICAQAYLVPQVIDFYKVLYTVGFSPANQVFIEGRYPGMWNSTVILPSFPLNTVCTNYGKTCASFLAFANNSKIMPNCEATSPMLPGVKIFPNGTQLIAKQYAKGLSRYVSFYTEPHNMSYYNAEEYSYEPSCPDGYVYPQHPNSSHTQYVGVTGCALACRPRVWTDGEWAYLNQKAHGLPAVGLILSVLLMLTFYTRYKELRSNYLMMLFTVLSFVASAASVAQSRKPFSEAFCYDNSINTMQELDSSSSCVAQGVILVYTFLALCGIVLMMVLDTYLKMKDMMTIYNSPIWIGFQLCFVLLLPIISTAYAAGNNLIGFFRTQPFCFIMSQPYAPKWIDLALVAIPVLVVSLLSLVMLLTVICGMNCCEEGPANNRIYAGDYNDEDDMYESRPRRVAPQFQNQQAQLDAAAAAEENGRGKNNVSVPDVVFIGVMIIVFLVYCFLRAEYHKQRDNQFANFVDWTKCIFRNYNGDNDHANSVCGIGFRGRPKVNGTAWQTFSLTSTSIVVSAIYLANTVWSIMYSAKSASASAATAEADKAKEAAVVAPAKPVAVASPRVASPRDNEKYMLVPVDPKDGHVQMV